MPQSEQALAIARFEDDFKSRVFHDRGVLYHIIGLGLWLSDLGLPNWEADKIEEKLKLYVNDLYEAREPTVEEIAKERSLDHSMGAHSLGFRQANNPVFARVAAYEQLKRSKWRRSGYPRVAAHLLDLASRDSELFLREICFTTGGPATFARIGVLKFIPPWEFAGVIAKLLYRDQSNVMIGLSIRYEHVAVEKELSEEVHWLRFLQKMVADEAAELSPISREALIGLSHHYLNKAV